MDKAAENTQVKGSVVLKSGIWYTLCTVIQKGIAFLTLPVFTRIMTQSDLGFFNTYATWITLFVTITTFDLPLSIIRSKHEVGKDGDSYAFSILTLTSVTTGVFALVCLLLVSCLLLSACYMEPDRVVDNQNGLDIVDNQGFTTVIILLLFLGSLIMISLGIIGYYVGNIYEEIKDRPRYIVSDTCGEE